MAEANQQPSESESAQVKMGLTGPELISPEAEKTVGEIRKALKNTPAEANEPNPFEEQPEPVDFGEGAMMHEDTNLESEPTVKDLSGETTEQLDVEAVQDKEVDIDDVFAGIESETVSSGEGIIQMKASVNESQTLAMILQSEFTKNPDEFLKNIMRSIYDVARAKFRKRELLNEVAHVIVESKDENGNPIKPDQNTAAIEDLRRILFNKGISIGKEQARDILKTATERIIKTKPTPGELSAAKKAAKSPLPSKGQEPINPQSPESEVNKNQQA